MNKDELSFKISQLRQDKIIYAVDSIALSAIAMLLYFSLPEIFPNISEEVISSLQKLLVLSSLMYWLYVAQGNFRRVVKIKQLEKELYDN